jgi:hypothetical protein
MRRLSTSGVSTTAGSQQIPADAYAGGTSLGEARSFVAELACSPGTALVMLNQSMDQCNHGALIISGAIWTKPISPTFARFGQPD